MKQKFQEMINQIPDKRETEIIVERYDDQFIFHNYEKNQIKLTSTHFIFVDTEGKTIYKTRFENILKFRWKPIFREKINEVVEGQYNRRHDKE